MMEARVTEDRDDESPAEVGGTVVAETAPGAKPEDTSAFTEVASKKEVTLNELLVIAKAYAQPEQIRSAVEEALAGANKLSDKDDREIDIDAFRLALTYIVDGVKPKNPNYLTGGFPEDAVAVLQYYQDARQFWTDFDDLKADPDTSKETLRQFLETSKKIFLNVAIVIGDDGKPIFMRNFVNDVLERFTENQPKRSGGISTARTLLQRLK